MQDVGLARDLNESIAQFGELPTADVYNVVSFMSDELISLFYAAADAVLANSGHEPFGLVGLEVMAAGGIVFVGSTGEDYAVPFLNSVVLDTDDPFEIGIALDFLGEHPEVAARIREDAQETARSFSWENVIQDNLIGKLEYVSRRQLVEPPVEPPLMPTFQGKGRGDAGLSGADKASRAAGRAAGGSPATRSLPVRTPPTRLPRNQPSGRPRPRRHRTTRPRAIGRIWGTLRRSWAADKASASRFRMRAVRAGRTGPLSVA